VTRKLVGVALAIVTLGIAAEAAQFPRVPESERWVKLGTRLPPLPAGEGGLLRVHAPKEFCGGGHLLQVVFQPQPGVYQPVVRLPAQPAECHWDFDGLAEGDYTATIQLLKTEEIVATAGAHVMRGGAVSMVMEPTNVEIEGVVTFASAEGKPLADARLVADLQIKVNLNQAPSYEWLVPLAADGSYHVSIGGFLPPNDACIRVVRRLAMNFVSLKCEPFTPGLHRLDATAVLPPGLIHVTVAADDSTAPYTFVTVSIGRSGTGVAEFLTSFKGQRGYEGEFMADYRPYEIMVMSADRKTRLASASVTPSAEQPVHDVKLTIR
jgi:hypothetical protein